jgi:hypothetical protein
VQDKVALRKLLKEQFHHGVSPEVLRELDHGRSRGDAAPLGAGKASGAKTSHVTEDFLNMAPVMVQEMDF